MTTIPEVVEHIVRRSPFLEEALVDDIINYSALARMIKTEIESVLWKDVQEGAIVMALKRLKPRLRKANLEAEILEYMRHMGEIIVRSDLVDYAFENSPTLMHKQQLLLQELQDKKEVFHTSSKGVYETNIITGQQVAERLEEIFAGETLLSKISNLASVTMRMPTSYERDVPGVYYYVMKKLAWEDINVVEIISTKHEFSLIVEKDKVNMTFNILHRLKSQ